MLKKSKILMISYQFPPDTGSIQRIQNFIKYLPENGWVPIILTHKSESELIQNIDKKLLTKNIAVYRTGKEPNLQNKVLKLLENNEKPSEVNKITKSPLHRFANIKSIFKKIKHFLIWPDMQVWWIPFAVIKSCQIIKKEKIKIVYIVTPPHSSSLIGYILKKLFSIKLIVDFRDPWANDVDIIMPTALHRVCHKMAEKLIVKSSNAILTTTEYHSNYFKEYVSSDKANTIHTITNGVDLENFKPRKSFHNNCFTIVYTGNFDSSRYPIDFLTAVSNIITTHPSVFTKNSINFYGNINPNLSKDIINLNLSDFVKQCGIISYEEVIDEIASAAVLLLIVHNDTNTPKFCIPAKLFEYMATGRPILSISPPGEASDIIEKYKLGKNIEHKNIKEIEQTILNYHDLFLKGQLESVIPPNEILYQFDRKNLTKELATILNNCNN